MKCGDCRFWGRMDGWSDACPYWVAHRMGGDLGGNKRDTALPLRENAACAPMAIAGAAEARAYTAEAELETSRISGMHLLDSLLLLHDRIESLGYTPLELKHEAEAELLALSTRALGGK